MKQDEARPPIFAEWDIWANENPRGDLPPGNHRLAFFAYLKKEKPELLDFQCREDKWQKVNAWLMNRGIYY